MQTKILNSFLVLALMLVFGGCLGKDLPRVQHYELSVDSAIIKQNKAKIANAQKRSFAYAGTEASPKIANRKIAYKTSANAIEYFAKNEWIEPLPTMVDSLLFKIAQEANISLLESANPKVSRFKIQILDLYYDETKEEIALNLLVRQRDSNHSIMRTLKVQRGGFDEIIKAMNQALNDALLHSLTLLD